MASVRVHPSILRADRVRAAADAQDILAEAKAEAVRLRDEAAAERQEALEQAIRDGLRQGLTEAAALTAQAAKALDLFWREREGELGEVALAVAHRILSTLPPTETLVHLALDAISEHGRDVGLAVRVRPEIAVVLRSVLQEKDYGDRVDVIADPALPSGGCTLVHPRGRTEIGLLAQFRAMLNSLPGPAVSDLRAAQ